MDFKSGSCDGRQGEIVENVTVGNRDTKDYERQLKLWIWNKFCIILVHRSRGDTLAVLKDRFH